MGGAPRVAASIGTVLFLLAAACSLTALDGLTGGDGRADGGDPTLDDGSFADGRARDDGGPGLDGSEGDSGPGPSTDSGDDGGPPGEPIVVLQRRVCPFKSTSKTFGCAFPVTNVAGNAFLVHLYFNYADAELALASVSDDNGNAYAFLDVGEASCPAALRPNHACCSAAAAKGTCQGWALAQDVTLATQNPAKVTFTISGGAETVVAMGAEVFEIAGLADAALDVAAAGSLDPGANASTPTITPTKAAELVIAGFTSYTSSTSVMTPPPGWTVDQDSDYFTAGAFVVGGDAGTSYGGTSMGTITNLVNPGTATILALKGR